MNIDNLIISRHSIRDYQDKDVDYRKIGEILELCRYAPSSGNIQNWRFIIVKDKEKKEKISRSCLDQLWMNQAPVFIVICYDNRNIKVMYQNRYQELSIHNASIIATMIMLKATDLGLGTCWIDVTNPNEISSLVKLPDFIIPSIIITLGYPSETYKKTTRNTINTMAHFEEYRKKQINTSIFPLSKYIKKAKEKLKSKIKR